MKIASAKIRLDLYNKRFSVYTAALEYYQSVWWGTLDDVNEKAHVFTKAYRESLFLFSSNDGVYEILSRIQQNGGAIRGYLQHKQEKNPGTSDSDTTAVLHERNVEGRAEFEKNLNLLEKKIEKYLRFKAISGWRFF
jgi:hypothetical protein